MASANSMQNYEILRKLGQGSYGSVYLARQKHSGKQCVMKRMVLRQLNDKERQSAFQEAQVLRALSHPNIVAYIDTQATASKLYLFMQFCDGGDLEQRLAQLKKEGGAVSQPQLLDAARAELSTIPDLAGTDYVALSKLELVNSCIDEAVRH